MNFKVKIAAYVIRILTEKVIPDIGLTALEENYNGEFLSIIAGLSKNENPFLMVDYFNEVLTENEKGVLLITHNHYNVENIKADSFYNIEGMTKDEWLNRKITPTNLEELKKTSVELMRAIQNSINKNKNEKNK